MPEQLTATPAALETSTPSRALGITALVLTLVPTLVYASAILFPQQFLEAAESLGLQLAIANILFFAAPAFGVTGLILGIVAARLGRGRVAAIIAIVLGVLLVAYSVYSFVRIGITAPDYNF